MNEREQLTNEAYEIQPLWPSPSSFLFRVTGRSAEFPPGDAFSSPPSVLALLFHGEGLTRHFHFDKRPTQNTPCRGWEVWAKTNTHGPPATTFSPIKQYLLYCTKQWIRTEILHNVILVGILPRSSLDARLTCMVAWMAQHASEWGCGDNTLLELLMGQF